MPKALVPVEGVPMMERLLDRFGAEGFERVVVNVHHFADRMIAFLDAYRARAYVKNTMEVLVSDESTGLLDTGGGIKKAAALMDPDAPFLVHNVDVISNAPLAWILAQHQPGNLASLVVSDRQTARYFLIRPSDHRVVGWTHTQTGQICPPDLPVASCIKRAFAGIHVISPRIKEVMASWPDAFPIIDFYVHVAPHERLQALEWSGFKMVDIGKPQTLEHIHLNEYIV